jgi:hypothetical protein
MWINRDMPTGINLNLLSHVAESEEELNHLSFLNDMRHYAETKGKLEQAWLILSGDWHGCTFLTVPFKLVGPKARIEALLWTLFDSVYPDGNYGYPEPAHASLIHTDRPEKGETHWIDGQLRDTLWLSDRFANRSVLSDMQEMHEGCVISHFEVWAENGIGPTRDELKLMSWEELARKELDLRI